MKSINLGFCRCDLRKFRRNRNIEFAFFDKQGGFKLAIYLHLPIYWLTRKAFIKGFNKEINNA